MILAKCPRSNCTFRFDASQVPAGAIIECPSCGHHFTLTESASTNSHPADFSAIPSSVARKPTAAKRHHLKITLIATVVIALLSAGLAILSVSDEQSATTATARSELRKSDLNFAIQVPTLAWQPDSQAQAALTANVIAYRHTSPPAWVALSVRDYDTVNPDLAELHERMRNQLAAGFDYIAPELTSEPAKLGGHNATRYPFRGVYRPTSETCRGDCIIMSHLGVAYWLYAWHPETADPRQEIAEFRAGFRTLGLRERWQPKTVAPRVFVGHGLPYHFVDRERLWVESRRPATDEDPHADLLLEAVLKTRERGDHHPRAEAVVLIVESNHEPLTVARHYVESRYRKRHIDLGNRITWIELSPAPTDTTPQPDQNQDSPVVRCQMRVGDADSFRSADKLVIFSAIAVENSVIIAEASCAWSDRAYWEERFTRLVSSLNIKP